MKFVDTFAASTVADADFRRLKDFVLALTGLAYYADKDCDLATRVGRRLRQLGLSDCATYLTLLEDPHDGESERDRLIAELTIGETFFFRHGEMFNALRDIVLPDLLQRNRTQRRLRIWSAGCSIGAEPYSLSILLRRELAAQTCGWDINILGTDINREFLARAREGVFEEWALRSMPDQIKRDCFTSDGKSWSLAAEYREWVSFQYHNLVEHPFPSLLHNLFAFDLVLCRNVMIYFHYEIVRLVVDRFHHSLVDGGWLLVGHAEPNIQAFREFRTVNAPGAVLYQKPSDVPGPARPPSSWFPTSVAEAPSASGGSPLPGPFRADKIGGMMQPPARSTAPFEPLLPSGDPPAMSSVEDTVSPSCTATRDGAASQRDAELAEIRALADQGALEQGLQRCEELLARNKLNPAAYFYEALLLEQMGRHHDTEQALRRAVYLDRNYVLAHYYLGLTQQKQGQNQAAARSFRNVISLLAPLEPQRRLPDADDLTVAELTSLTRMQLETLQQL